MANTLVTKEQLAKAKISTQGASLLINEVNEGMKTISKGFLSIAPQVAKLYDTKAHFALGYKNFDEMCAQEFNMSHGTTVGIRKVFQLIGTVSTDNKYSIPDKYMEYGYTKLLLIATDKAKFEEAGIKPFEVFTPEMSIKDMKSALALALADKSKEQDDNAIDTEATEATEATESQEIDNKPFNAQIHACYDVMSHIAKNDLKYNKKNKAKVESYISAILANLKELSEMIEN